MSDLYHYVNHRKSTLNKAALCNPRAASLRSAFRICVAITRQHSRSFFLSSQLLPAEKRNSIRVLYAFCRISDDLVDSDTQDAAHALAEWVEKAHTRSGSTHHPVLLAWHAVSARYEIAPELIDELFAGIRMDLTINRYATFPELHLYCYRVASVVGLIAMQIIGHSPGATTYAIKLGVALQLTNILRDVGEDARRGRIYLPQTELAGFALSDTDILSGCCDERFQALMRFQIARAEQLYEQAWPGIALLSPDSQLAIGAAAEIYRGILHKIVANGYDVFNHRASVPLGEKLLIVLRVLRRLRTIGRAR